LSISDIAKQTHGQQFAAGCQEAFMPEMKKKPVEHQPHGRRDRDSANDRPHKRGEYTAGADGDRDVDASAAEEAETFKPDKNGSGW
jgi:hypothetical protein